MTAEPDLLPMPEGVDVIFSPDGNGAALDVFTAEQVQDYARANVEHHAAAKDAEIEALRAEVGELHMHAQRRDKYAVEKAAQALDWKKRAERLAKVLQLAKEHIDTLTPEWYSAGQRVLAEIRAALRDHDQETKK